MTTRYRRLPSDPEPVETKAFGGVMYQKAKLTQTDMAVRNMKRNHRDKQLAQKLDELLGPVDPDEWE